MVYTPFLEFTATPQGSVQLRVIQKTPLPNCENQHPGLRIIAIWQIPKSGSMVQFKSSSRWVSDTCPSVVFGGATRYHFWWTHWGFVRGNFWGVWSWGLERKTEEKKRCCWNGLDMFRSRRRPRRNDHWRLVKGYKWARRHLMENGPCPHQNSSFTSFSRFWWTSSRLKFSAQVLGSSYSVLRSRPVVRCVQCRRVLEGSRRIRGRKVAGKEMAEQDMEYTLHIHHCWTKKMKNLFQHAHLGMQNPSMVMVSPWRRWQE